MEGLYLSKELPTEEGFYWCKPMFGHVEFLGCDEEIVQGELSVAQVVMRTRGLHARFIGHKIPHRISSRVISNTLWGRKVE